jgi:hypothetical protein
MAALRNARPLDQIGRKHLQLCQELVSRTGGLLEATAAAAKSLRIPDIRRACSSAEDSARLLHPIVEAMDQGSPPGSEESFVFHASIFAAALRADVDEPLLPMAGESAAQDLALMLMLALDSEDYEFVLQGAADMLERFGDMLGQAYYGVEASGFRMAAITRMHRDRPTAMANLDVETRLELHRVTMRRLLPRARRECKANKTRSEMLDAFEDMLDTAHHVPPAREPDMEPDQETEAPSASGREPVLAVAGTGISGPGRTSGPTGAPLDGRQVSTMVTDAFRHAAARLHPSEPLDTLRLFVALETFDMSSEWDRLWLEAGDTEFLAALKLSDPEPGRAGTWDAVSLTGTCTRSLAVVVRLCDTYSLWPAPVGALALALVADPRSSAAQALMAQGNLNHSGLIELLQEITLGGTYENIESLLAMATQSPGKERLLASITSYQIISDATETEHINPCHMSSGIASLAGAKEEMI